MTEEQTHSQVHAVFGLRVGQELRDLFLGRSEGEDVQLSEVFLARRWGQKMEMEARMWAPCRVF